jgi:PAS domain S-box-containing protein
MDNITSKPKNTIRILHVEDSEDDAILTKANLKRQGFDVEIDHVDTIERLETALNEPHWDIIITDYMLLGFTALDTLRLIRERGLETPCIVVSGRITDETAMDAVRAGAVDYVLKDNLKRIGTTIQNALNNAKQKRELKQAQEKLDQYYAELEQQVQKRTAELTQTNQRLRYEIEKRIKAEEALMKSEERFRSVLNNSLEVIYRFNIQTGHYEYMSPAIRRMGFEPEEMTAMTNDEVLSRVHPDDLAKLRRELASLAEKGVGYSEYRFLGKDGIYRWWSNQLIITNDENGKPLYRDGYVRDVTEHKKAEELMKENEDKYRSIFDNMTDRFALGEPVFDDKGQPYDVRYLEVNKAWEQVTKIPRSQALGKTHRELFLHPAEEVIEKFIRVALSGQTDSYELYVPNADIWVRGYIYSPFKGKSALIISDITERKKAEESLKWSEANLERAEAVASLGHFNISLKTGKVKGSKSAKLIYGYNSEEAELSDIKKLTLPEYRVILDEAMDNLISSGKPYNMEFKIKRESDGRIIDINSIAEIDCEKQIIFGTVQDITERKKTKI